MSESSGLPARRAAFRILCAVIIKGQSLEVLSDKYNDLSPQDTAFARALVMTVLRLYGPLQHSLRQLSTKKQKIKPKELGILACMGAAQIACLNVPDHAAVDTTLKIAVKNGFNRQKAFLNALLRNFTRQEQKELTINAETCHYPDWMIRHWIKDYGPEQTELLIQSLMQEPTLDITCPDPTMRETLMNEHQKAITPIGLHSLRIIGQIPPIPEIKGFKEGKWWVQNAASAHPISQLVTHPDLKDRMEQMDILDLCAAPGGKTMQLAYTGAKVTALDISDARIKRLKENLNRVTTPQPVKITRADALTHQGSYDLVVLDAPCTATGTLRRHPDAAFTKTESQMNELIALQSSMLAHAATMVKPDGFLLLCTCSLQKTEGEILAEQFIKGNSSFKISEKINGAHSTKEPEEEAVNKGFFRSLPHKTPLHGDGFFSCLFQRK